MREREREGERIFARFFLLSNGCCILAFPSHDRSYLPLQLDPNEEAPFQARGKEGKKGTKSSGRGRGELLPVIVILPGTLAKVRGKESRSTSSRLPIEFNDPRSEVHRLRGIGHFEKH